MIDQGKRKRQRSAKAYKLDISLREVCKHMLANNTLISARPVAAEVGISASSITRDPIRKIIITDAKRQQTYLSETVKSQAKRSRAKDAAEIANLKSKLEKLEEQNTALITSHKALYNVIREIGSVESWELFFSTALSVKETLSEIGACKVTGKATDKI